MEERPESLEERLRGPEEQYSRHTGQTAGGTALWRVTVCVSGTERTPVWPDRRRADGMRWAGEAEAASLALGKKEFGFYLGVNGQSLIVLK